MGIHSDDKIELAAALMKEMEEETINFHVKYAKERLMKGKETKLISDEMPSLVEILRMGDRIGLEEFERENSIEYKIGDTIQIRRNNREPIK